MAGKTKTESVNHLRAWREQARLTQQQLADGAGTTPSTISELESGERGLSPKWLRLLAPLLGTTPGFLLDHDPNDLDTAFLQAAMSVDPDDRRQVTDIILSFKAKRGR